MKKLRYAIMVCMCASLLMCGCEKKSEDSNGQSSNEPSDITIFDKVVAGKNVNDEKSLYDVTDTLELEDYEIVDVTPYEKEKILVVYNGESDSRIILYDLKDGDKEEDIKSHVYSDNVIAGVTNSKAAYIYDKEQNIYETIDVKDGKIKEYALDFTPESMIISESGNRLFYTLKNDCKVYQYITETENTSEMFDGQDVADNILLKSIKNDDSVFVVYVDSQDYSGYAELNIEMQEINYFDEMEGNIHYTGEEYIYTPDKNGNTIIIYNEQTPRLVKQFTLESAEEIKDFQVYRGGPYVFSKQEDADRTIVRFYDIMGGIMLNSIEIDDDYAIISEYYMSDFKAICLKTLYEDGTIHVLIWDYEAVSQMVS